MTIYMIIAKYATAAGLKFDDTILCFDSLEKAQKYAAEMEERNERFHVYTSIEIKEMPLF